MRFLRSFSAAVLGGMFFFAGVAPVFAQQQWSVLPRTDETVDQCTSRLQDYEASGLIASVAATKEAQDDAAKDQNDYQSAQDALAATSDSVAGCLAANGDPNDPACKAIAGAAKNAQDAQQKAQASQAAADQAQKLQDTPDNRAKLLGCAIKTGRISLQMVPYFITYVSNFLLGLVGLICVLFIVIGGYQYILGGITDQKDKGKKTIEHALMGLALATLSWVIVSIIMNALTS